MSLRTVDPETRIIEKHIIDGCPWEKITPFTWLKASLYGHYKNGFLYCKGGIGDQPDWYVKAMTKMSSKDNEMQADNMKKREREMKLQQQMGR